MYEPQRMLIFGLPKLLTPKKLKKLIGRQNNTDLWELEQLVPLEDKTMAQMICNTRATYEKLAQTIFELGKYSKKFECHSLSLRHIRDWTVIVEPAKLSDPHPFINKDCLWQIFEWCPLKTQIALAKVCRFYHELIEDIWHAKYKMLRYNLRDFHFKEHLNQDEICDFLTIVGAFVEHLVFWCYVYIPLSSVYNVDAMTGNYLTISKHLINSLMCRHLAYFPNLLIFEVEGKFLFDWVVRSLAINCKKLRIFRLLDCETRWLSGSHLWRLENLEECCLKDCKELQRRFCAKLCRRAKNLRALDIVQCERLQDAREMLLLCRDDMQRLEKLRMSALHDVTALGELLKLRRLKELQFFWYDNSEFEAILLPLLQHHRRFPYCLKFEQEPVYMENDSQVCLDRKRKAEMRERVTIEAPQWRLSEECVRTVGEFKNLRKIRCVYCRPFGQDHVLELPNRCTNLERIELFGCCDPVADYTFGRKWPIPLQRQKCGLSIDGVISALEVQRLREMKELPSPRRGRVLRSIDCCFE